MLISEIQTGIKPRFVVQFNLRCFSPESRVHILLTYLPDIKNFRFQQILDDEEFTELENMLHSVGIEFRNLEKTPYIADEPTQPDPEPEEDILDSLVEEGMEDQIFGRLFDELCTLREDIREVHGDKGSEEDKAEVIGKKARDFTRVSDAFTKYLRGNLSCQKTENPSKS